MNINRTYFSSVLLKGTLIFLLALFLPACVNDDDIPAPNPVGDDALVTVAIQVPGSSTPTSRALTPPDENKVNSIEVLVFEVDGGYKYTAYGRDINDLDAEGGKKEFTVRLLKGDCDIMILANSKGLISEVYGSSGITIGESQEDIQKKLIAKVGSDPKWNHNPKSQGYKAIPMSAERRSVEIEDNSNIKGVGLRRMLARVNVVVSGTAADNFKLESIRVYNYNTQGSVIPKEGWDILDEDENKQPSIPAGSTTGDGIKNNILIYSEKDEFSSDSLSSENVIYLFESMIGSATTLSENTCLVLGGKYDDKLGYYRVDFARDDTKKEEKVYMGLVRNHSYNVAITEVSGPGFTYPDDAFNSAPVNIEADVLVWDDCNMGNIVFDGQNYLSVNKSVFEFSRASYLSEDDQENQLIIKTDYIYAEDPDHENSGWKIVDVTDENGVTMDGGWLSVADDKRQGLPNVDGVVPLLVEENDENEPRVGYVVISAGRLELKVKVEQSNVLQPKLSILVKRNDAWVETNQIRFIQDNKELEPEPETYKIKWFPKDIPIEIYLNKGDGGKRPVQWKSGQDPLKGVDNGVLTSENGEVEFTVHPDMIPNYEEGSFDECQDLLQVRMNYTGDILMQLLQLQQFVKEIVIDANAVYTMDGKEHYVTVRSNVAWSIKPTKNISRNIGEVKDVAVVSNWEGVINEDETWHKDIYKGFYNLPDGDKVYFRTVDDIKNGTEIFLGDISFEATSVEEKVELKAYATDVLCASGVPQNNREANCYVLDPTSGAGILIPVHAANGVMIDDYKDGTNKQLYVPSRTTFGTEKIGKNTKFGAKLVWADNYGTAANGDKVGLAEDGMLYLVMPAGTGKKGYVLVMPGNPGKPPHMKKHGNAVVAVTSNPDGTGEILWSWHVWVTDAFNFTGEGLMNGRIIGGENSEERDHFGNPNNNAANWLDRNLGALTNNHIDEVDGYEGVTAAFGNLYQWGRKDPFPNTNITRRGATDEVVLRPIYDEDGEATIDISHTAMGITWTKAIQTPSYLYYGTISDKTNWNGEIDDLWGVTGSDNNSVGAFQGKSIFDPCPAGWRLPTKNKNKEFNSLDNLRNWNGHGTANGNDNKWHNAEISGIVWGKTRDGKGEGDFHYKGGYYPFSGGFYHTGSKLTYRGGTVCFFSWIAGRDDQGSNVYANNMYATSGGTAAGLSAQVHNALAVRCVKDVLTPYE